MKKVILALCMLVAVLCGTACGNNSKADSSNRDNADKNITIDVSKLGEELAKNGKFSTHDEMTAVNQTMADNVFDISEIGIKEESVYMGSGSSDLVAVFKIPDGKKNDLESKMKSYIDEQINQAQGYTPDQVNNLKNCIYYSVGQYYIVVVSNDNDTINGIIDKYK